MLTDTSTRQLPNGTMLTLCQGDITRQEADAIVNAANSSLLGGGGVDGAIHRAAGPQLLAECRTIGGCRTGEARITAGYNLPALCVIHTVGPVYGGPDAARLLASCYRSSLDLADSRKLRSLAFPAISTGAYRYPVEEAAQVSLNTVIEWARQHADTTITEVRMVLYSRSDYDVFHSVLSQLS